ncbi:MAG: hypothetical protein ACI9SP_002354 [Arenicella sp.]|jgi:hypothetical protein
MSPIDAKNATNKNRYRGRGLVLAMQELLASYRHFDRAKRVGKSQFMITVFLITIAT